MMHIYAFCSEISGNTSAVPLYSFSSLFIWREQKLSFYIQLFFTEVYENNQMQLMTTLKPLCVVHTQTEGRNCAALPGLHYVTVTKLPQNHEIFPGNAEQVFCSRHYAWIFTCMGFLRGEKKKNQEKKKQGFNAKQ